MGSGRKHYYKHEALLRYAKLLGFGEIHFRRDPATGLESYIAIHSNKLGPAIGGARCYPYHTHGQALKDALRLAYQMTLKAAASQLPHGGAKAVIIEPKNLNNRAELFHAFGDFVHEMNGRYITACDFGTSTPDMDRIANRTPYVIGSTRGDHSNVSPGPYTAVGVLRGIEAAVKFRLQRNSVEGLHVTVQGLGSVGYHLCELLAARGAKISVTDPNPDVISQCADECKATPFGLDDIIDIEADVFAPCALGGIINLDTISRLKTPIIAGSANNQLAHSKYGTLLHERGILYAPDFVINAGGLIFAAMVYDYNDPKMADEKIAHLYDTLYEIFERSKCHNIPTTTVANELAFERLNAKQADRTLVNDIT